MSIKDWFEKHFLLPIDHEDKTTSLRRAAAVLLCEIMHADHDISSEEQAVILAAMRSFLGMPAEEAAALYGEIEVLMQDALALQNFTSLLNEHYTEQEKQELLG